MMHGGRALLLSSTARGVANSPPNDARPSDVRSAFRASPTLSSNPLSANTAPQSVRKVPRCRT
eukprot:887675-Rhodomonas_salina.1